MNHPTFGIFERLWLAVTRGPGVLAPGFRETLAVHGTVPPELTAYIDMVRNEAYRITDADVEALRAAGCSDEEIFELTVATAVGAGLKRFDAGLAALAKAV